MTKVEQLAFSADLAPIQFNALEQFIKKLGDDATLTQRTAREARDIIDSYDNRVVKEQNHVKLVKNQFKNLIIQQINSNSSRAK